MHVIYRSFKFGDSAGIIFEGKDAMDIGAFFPDHPEKILDSAINNDDTMKISIAVAIDSVICKFEKIGTVVCKNEPKRNSCIY